jgi:hypothetical protein
VRREAITGPRRLRQSGDLHGDLVKGKEEREHLREERQSQCHGDNRDNRVISRLQRNSVLVLGLSRGHLGAVIGPYLMIGRRENVKRLPRRAVTKKADWLSRIIK